MVRNAVVAPVLGRLCGGKQVPDFIMLERYEGDQLEPDETDDVVDKERKHRFEK